MIYKLYAKDKKGKVLSFSVDIQQEHSNPDIVFMISPSMPFNRSPWKFAIITQEGCEGKNPGEWLICGSSFSGPISVIDYKTIESKEELEKFKEEFKNHGKQMKHSNVKTRIPVFVDAYREAENSGDFYNFSVKSRDEVDYRRIAKENYLATRILVNVGGEQECFSKVALDALRA